MRPAGATPTLEVIYAQGNAASGGLVLAIERGRFLAGVWPAGGAGAWLDLGPATAAVWQHVALVFDGTARAWRGFVDGAEVAATSANVPERSDALSGAMAFGGVHKTVPVRVGRDRVAAAGSAAFTGGVDEFRCAHRALDTVEVALLALRRPENVR